MRRFTPTLTPASGELELVQRFANSVQIDTRADRLRDTAATLRWLEQNGEPLAAEPSETERATLVALRECLREMLAANHAGEQVERGRAQFAAIAARTPLVVEPGDDGAFRLEPTGEGALRMAGRIVAITYNAMNDGSWQRLKLCSAGDCDVAFYDGSKNRSAAWCSMAGCGNREKVRAYQRRQAETRSRQRLDASRPDA